MPSIHARDLVQKMKAEEDFTLLDVRKITEFKEARLSNTIHIYVRKLPGRLDDLPKDRPVVTFCRSGQRAVIAATI